MNAKGDSVRDDTKPTRVEFVNLYQRADYS